MKKNKKEPKEQGIISIVQSPDEGGNLNECSIETTSDAPKEQGIISTVQAPDEAVMDKTDK